MIIHVGIITELIPLVNAPGHSCWLNANRIKFYCEKHRISRSSLLADNMGRSLSALCQRSALTQIDMPDRI